MKKIYVIIIAIGLIITLAYIGVRVFLSSGTEKTRKEESAKAESALDLRPLLKAKLIKMVKEGSEGLYDLSIDSLSLDVLNSTVTAFNVLLQPDTASLKTLDDQKKAPDDVFKISFSSLQINGINIGDVINQKNIDLDLVSIKNPTIEVYHQKRSYNKNEREVKEDMTLYQRLMKEAKKIAVNRVVIDGGTLISHNQQNKKTSKFNDVNITLDNILIDSSTQYDRSRFLFAKEADISTKNYVVRTADSLYLMKFNRISIAATKGNMVATGVSIAPRYGKQAFQKQISRMKERFDVTIPAISFKNVDWWNLVNNESFYADEIVMDNGKLDVYLDRSLPPPKSKVGSYPHQLVMDLGIPVYFKKLSVNNLDLVYEEFNPLSGQSGEVSMQDIQLTATNITNIQSHIKNNSQSKLTASAKFLGRIPLNATFHFDLARYKTGHFTADVSLGAVEGTSINSIAEPLGLFKVDKGKINKVSANITGNNTNGKGKVQFLYDDLNLSLLKKDDENNDLKEKKIMGFIANLLVIKDENPSGNNEPRTAKPNFERDPKAGFFNLIWKTLLSGILEIVGANPNLAKNKK